MPSIRCFKSIRVPRSISPDIYTAMGIELQMFCDASEIGYDAVGYIGMTASIGLVRCSFILGKPRATPRGAITIPRPELTAALLAARMRRPLVDKLRMRISRVVFGRTER
ncbi:uncharacterized protein DEA37_0004524 [Paragonimus westermani]|uniref:Uncharacterized protein n=1 Tax=Paragonimus westermani TaxID=34504 RepID=A0A5J4NMK1_9TREM|nr:uncharacterized protein DEA37_0004524 [Paragonimus westermani]